MRLKDVDNFRLPRSKVKCQFDGWKQFVKFVLKFRSVSTPLVSRTLLDTFKKTYSNSVSILDINSRKFSSVIYNSFPRLYRAISIRRKGFQSLAKFAKSSDVNQIHVFEQKTGLSTKDNRM